MGFQPVDIEIPDDAIERQMGGVAFRDGRAFLPFLAQSSGPR
jgi:hypothetical protein